MANITVVSEAFCAGDRRLASALDVLDELLPAPVDHVQNLVKATPIRDRCETIEGWLHPPAGSRPRAQVLSNGRKGADLVQLTVLNRIDRRSLPGVPITALSLALEANALQPSDVLPLVEALGDACHAIWVAGFHGAETSAVAANIMEHQRRTGIKPDLPTRTSSGKPVHSVLGWVGFVNVPSAGALQFPGHARMLGDAWPSRGGAGWCYRLTAEPLDLRVEAHRSQVAVALDWVTSFHET